MTQLCVRMLAGQLGWRLMMSRLCFNTPHNAQCNRSIQYNYLLIRLHKTALQTMLTHARKILRQSEADDILNMSNEHEQIHPLKLVYKKSMPNRRGDKRLSCNVSSWVYLCLLHQWEPSSRLPTLRGQLNGLAGEKTDRECPCWKYLIHTHLSQ